MPEQVQDVPLGIRAPASDGPLRRIGLVATTDRDTAPVVRPVAAWARDHDAELLRVVTSHGVRGEVEPAELLHPLPPLEGPASGLDLLLAVGRDGTMLGALRLALGSAVPVLGVAYGHLGCSRRRSPTAARRFWTSLPRAGTARGSCFGCAAGC